MEEGTVTNHDQLASKDDLAQRELTLQSFRLQSRETLWECRITAVISLLCAIVAIVAAWVAVSHSR